MERKILSEQQASKKSYQTPQLTVHGSVEQLTEAMDQDGDWHRHQRGGSGMKIFPQPA